MMKPAPKNRIRLWAVLVWLALWQVGSLLLGESLLLPSPLAALARLAELAVTAGFWRAVGWSALRIIGGFLAACLAASALAVPAYRFRPVREFLAPAVACIKAVPVASFIILALVWLNSQQLSFFISFLMVFPPVYLAVLTGIGQADGKLLEMARVYRVPLWRQVRWLYLPAVAPHFRSAVSLGLGLCWKAGIAAEVIGLPGGSMGERLYMAKVYFQTADLFAWTAAIVAVSMAFEKVFLLAVNALLRKAGDEGAG